MRKFREWMHTTGRNKVIAVVFLIAIAIVLHYFIVERDCYIGAGKPNPTVSPKSAKEEIIGGDSIGSVDPDTTMIPGDAIHPSTTPKVGNSSKQKGSEQKQSQE